MAKLRQIFSNMRVIIVLIAVVLAIGAISPNPFATGVAIRSVDRNSSAFVTGRMESPSAMTPPMMKERVIRIDQTIIRDTVDYYAFMDTVKPNKTIAIQTTKAKYLVTTEPLYQIDTLPELVPVTLTEIVEKNITVNGTEQLANVTINTTVLVNKTITSVIGTKDIGLKVYDAPKNNLRLGLDLQGGTRVILSPEKKLDTQEMDILLANMKERLNIYGLSDVIVVSANDLSGNQYVLVEIAGVNEDEVKELLAKQGKFEAKIANESVFRGGQDIKYVCRSADCSGIDPNEGCGQYQDAWTCRFRFSISLSTEAAERQAALTGALDIITENGNEYLSKDLELYLDDQNVDVLKIGSDLRGRAVTDIAISGSGQGSSQESAASDALKNMKRLQTILATGSLPVKLTIIKTDSISPVLGQQFLGNAFLMGLLAILAVVGVLLISYRKLHIAIPITLTSLLEVFLMLGVAALIGWNIDLSAIAGIIVAVGTGVNDQVVITDEVLRGETRKVYAWKEKMKNAFFIIMGAYLTITVAMLPLLFAGAGLLRGFALTTIIGVSVGVFITRPAYANIIEILLKE